MPQIIANMPIRAVNAEVRCDCVKNFHVIAVDDEKEVLNLYHNAFVGLDNYSIETMTSPAKAYETILQKEFDCIILDWKMPELSGTAILNRIRAAERHRFTPILVVSGFLERKDLNLIEDFPLVKALEKPFDITDLPQIISDLWDEREWYKSNYVQIKMILESNVDDLKLAIEDIEQLMDLSPYKEVSGLIAAKILSDMGLYKEALSILERSIDGTPDKLAVFAELAKLKIRNGDITEAIQLLNHVQQESPDNLERLVVAGDAYLRTMDYSSAQEKFKQAAKIDGTNDEVKARLKLTQSLMRYEQLNVATEVTHSFASVLNAVGITMIRQGNYKDGIRHYKSAIDVAQDPFDKARLAFNLGLAYYRDEKYETSLSWFKNSKEYSEQTDEGFKKADIYIKKIKAILDGENVIGIAKNQSSKSKPNDDLIAFGS